MFQASLRAVEIISQLGFEQTIKNLRCTAPHFNNVWSDGVFSSEKAQELHSQIKGIGMRLLAENNARTARKNSTIETPPGMIKTQQIVGEVSNPEKTMRDYSEEDKEKMIDRAIALKRKYPWVRKSSRDR